MHLATCQSMQLSTLPLCITWKMQLVLHAPWACVLLQNWAWTIIWAIFIHNLGLGSQLELISFKNNTMWINSIESISWICWIYKCSKYDWVNADNWKSEKEKIDVDCHSLFVKLKTCTKKRGKQKQESCRNEKKIFDDQYINDVGSNNFTRIF